MQRVLNVFFNNNPVGKLIEYNNQISFSYDKDWINNGFSISPFLLPLKEGIFSPNEHAYDSTLFGPFQNCYPNKYMLFLIQKLIDKYNFNFKFTKPDKTNILDYLAIFPTPFSSFSFEISNKNSIGKNFQQLKKIIPELNDILYINDLNNLEQVFNKFNARENNIKPFCFANINNEHWIIKASRISYKNSGEQEYKYLDCAKACGIRVPQKKLFSPKKYIGTKLFNIKNNKNIFSISAFALITDKEQNDLIKNISQHNPDNFVYDYKDLICLTKALSNNPEDIEQIFKQMCFNIFAMNKDDHLNQFIYLYDEEEKYYKPSPAFDIVPSTKKYHKIDINGKTNPTIDDILQLAKVGGLQDNIAKNIIDNIKYKTKILSFNNLL
jgi:serine/threonine-protein kinase HipA